MISYTIPNQLVHAPALLPSFVPATVQQCALFFDPGLENTETSNTYCPPDLPLEQKKFAQIVREYDSLANTVADPALLNSLFGSSGASTESSRDIIAELENKNVPQAAEKEKYLERLSKAQIVLGLGMLLQKRHLELVELDSSYNQAKSKFENSLGMEQGDTLGDATINQSDLSDESLEMPWATVLFAMLTLLPEDVGLFVCDAGIIDTWKDFGIVFEALDDKTTLPSGCSASGLYCARIPGYHLLQKKRPVEGALRLNAERVVVISS